MLCSAEHGQHGLMMCTAQKAYLQLPDQLQEKETNQYTNQDRDFASVGQYSNGTRPQAYQQKMHSSRARLEESVLVCTAGLHS